MKKMPTQIPQMDMSKNTPILVFLIVYVIGVSGLTVPQPDKLDVTILDGEAIVHWNNPVDAPSNFTYNVQMAKYNGEWAKVRSCTRIQRNYCDLSSLIEDRHIKHKVKVQLVTRDHVSLWTQIKFQPNAGEWQPPSFSLWATSSTLTIHVHTKPVLRKLFPYGVTYTIYLTERGQSNKNTTAYLNNDEGQDQRTFTSLHWGREYCISIKLEGKGALRASPVSPQQCLLLPEQAEWFLIAVSSLSILGAMAFVAVMAAVLVCYLRRPEKTPAALKSPVSGWLPLSVGEGVMEVVTDRGWFLSSYRTQIQNGAKVPAPRVTVAEDSGEEDRRTSVDSGVQMESTPVTNSGSTSQSRQEDSGCGSLGGADGSTCSKTGFTVQDDRTGGVRKREDSGLGMGCHLDSSSLNLDGQEGVSLRECVVGGNYCHQSHAAMQINACDKEEVLKETCPDLVLAEVITGYRAGPQSCICSGAGQCTWCHKQGNNRPEVCKRYEAMRIESELLNSTWDFADLDKKGLTFSSYFKNSQTDTVIIDDFETTFLQLGETFPLLTALSPPTLVEEGQDFIMNHMSLSLCDVELKTE